MPRIIKFIRGVRPMVAKKRFPEEDAKKLKDAGFNNTKIGKMLGFNVVTVGKYLKDYVPKNNEEKPLTEGKQDDNIKEVEDIIPEIKEEVVEVEPKKKPTTPWNAAGNPWVPDIFRLPKKHKGFKAHFASPVKLEHRLNEGYQIADARNWVDEETLLKKEDGQIDTALRRGGMILMEIPQELFEQKKAHRQRKTDLQDVDRQKKRMLEESKKMGKEEFKSGDSFGLHEV